MLLESVVKLSCIIAILSAVVLGQILIDMTSVDNIAGDKGNIGLCLVGVIIGVVGLVLGYLMLIYVGFDPSLENAIIEFFAPVGQFIAKKCIFVWEFITGLF